MNTERIVVMSGPIEGAHSDIIGALTIGRSPENGLQLNDPQISRAHAIIQQTPAGTILRDLGSGNGTYIGNRRVLEYRLSDGDVIHLGPIELRYEVVAEDRDSKPAKTLDRDVQFNAVEDRTLEASSTAAVYQTFFAAPRGEATADQLRQAQQRLAAVYEANQIISSEPDLNKLFARVMDAVFSLVPAHNGVILLKDRRTGKLDPEYVKSGLPQGQVSISSTTIVNRAFEEGKAVFTPNAADDSRFGAGASIIAQRISSAMCVPLKHHDETLGVVYVDTRGTTNAFTKNDLQLLVALAGPAAIAIRNAQHVARLKRDQKDTLIALANSIEARDHYTVGHTWRVTNFALAIGRILGWPEDRLREIEMGGLLHDIGKIAVEDAILRKPDRLTDEEFAKMKVHPERGARMMQDIELLLPCVPYALYHHERFDGKGYPFGMAGGNIPIEGRILAVADAFDAMTSSRPYRKGMDPEIAIARINEGKNTQFDPDIADVLVSLYRDGQINQILQDHMKKDAKSIVCPFCSTYIRAPEASQVGYEFQCGVCHRWLRLLMANDVYYGELMPAAEISEKSYTTPEL